MFQFIPFLCNQDCNLRSLCFLSMLLLLLCVYFNRKCNKLNYRVSCKACLFSKDQFCPERSSLFFQVQDKLCLSLAVINDLQTNFHRERSSRTSLEREREREILCNCFAVRITDKRLWLITSRTETKNTYISFPRKKRALVLCNNIPLPSCTSSPFASVGFFHRHFF